MVITTMKQIIFRLNGRPIVKKNSKRIFTNKYTGKPVVASSVAFKRYERDCLEQIMILRSKRDIPPTQTSGNIKVHTSFFVKGKYSFDADNAHTSILDILQAAKVIDDDKNVIAGSYEKKSGCDEWAVVITLEKI